MSATQTYAGDQIDQTTFYVPQRTVEVALPERRAPELNLQCLCPFCGEFNSTLGKPCLHCNRMDTTATRALATDHTGSWFVRDEDHSVEPEMAFDQLQSLIHLQLVTARSVVRGPATGQLWRLAGTVRGLSREFGQCYCCGNHVESTQAVCAHCDCVQTLEEFAPAFVSEPELVPETPGPAREALFHEHHEPTIRVHSRAHLDETPADDYYFISRPVIAERTERHVPKDDLLTPKDLANAFQLEFEPEYANAGLSGRVRDVTQQAKVVLACGGAIAVGFLLGMQGLRIVAAGNIPPAPALAAVDSAPVKLPPLDPPVVKYVAPESKLAAESEKPVVQPTLRLPEEKPVEPTRPPVLAANGRPASAHSNVTQVMLIEPIPVTASEDNPTVLMSAGLNAESNGNFAAAVRFYERIQSLPSSQWPAHLDTRLQLARQELKDESR